MESTGGRDVAARNLSGAAAISEHSERITTPMTSSPSAARNLWSALDAVATAEPDRRYFKCTGDWVTFGALRDRADCIAAGLARLGTSKGDRVAVLASSRDEVVEVLFACARLGAIQLSLNTFLKGEFLRYQLVDSGAMTIIADAAGWRALQPVLDGTSIKHVFVLDSGDSIGAQDGSVATMSFAELRTTAATPINVHVEASDPMAILYTSGSTGPPKGCVLGHGYYLNVPRSYLAGDRVRPGDRIFTALPLFHTAGQVMMLMLALTGPAELVIEPVFHASTFMARAREERATVLWGVGAMAMAILAQPPSPEDACSSFRVAQFQPLAPDKQLELQERFSVPVITEGYGQTECVPITASKLSDERRRASIGRAADHLEVRLVDDADEEVPRGAVGEIVVRPRMPNVMYQGYWGRPEATLAASRNLWHHTGDYARQDADGYFYFVDRKSDAIRRRGENISSFELEAAIGAHPMVAEVAVHAVPAEFGEDEVKANLVMRPEATVTPAELFAFFKHNLPYFAVPRYVELVDELPRNALQKLLKHELRARGVTAATWDLTAMGFEIQRHERR